jgi:tetratricopeptide (TPR) repeat protein
MLGAGRPCVARAEVSSCRKKLNMARLLAFILFFSGLTLSAQTNLQKAVAYSLQNIEDSANLYFNKAIEEAPNNYLAYLRQGMFLYSLNKDAKTPLLKANTLRKNSASFYLALVYASERDTLNTIKYLNQNLSSEFQVMPSYIKMEKAFSFLEKTELWKQLWEQNWYNKSDEQIGELLFLYHSGNYMEVINTISNLAINNQKISHEMYYLRACSYLSMENYTAALSDVNEAIRINKHQSNYFELRADIKIKLQQYTQASKDYQEAKRLDILNFDAIYKNASCFLLQKQYEQSLEEIAIYTFLLPQNEKGLYIGAQAAFHCNKYIKSLEYLNELIKAGHSNADYYILRAKCYAQTKLTNNALQDLNNVLNKQPQNISALLERGNVYYSIKQYPQACEDWKKAKSLGNIHADKLLWMNCK